MVDGLVQQLAAVRAKALMVLLLFFHGCKVIAVDTFPALHPHSRQDKGKMEIIRQDKIKMEITESFKDFSRSPTP